MVGFIFVRIQCQLPVYPCVYPKSIYITHFRHNLLSNYSSQMLETLPHCFFCMPYGEIHFCTNSMSTSCLPVCLSIECIANFCHSFLSNYSTQVLEILALSVLACNVVELIFVQIQYQLPVYPCICPYIVCMNIEIIYSH
jgi:hypothetical protein